ncbi:MGT1 [Candida oxycetoniae]|uniref:Methylated-DNA--protein-cysteine methyltransferase n=1 Tax=Candida oxycetoniae TaxID=497107 RepID=A0AAI9T0P6_9ASCO|nr:MGT1 [Candida oxycetoniae]KAI3406648.2 MGT1 [Candida oxycetoniae]
MKSLYYTIIDSTPFKALLVLNDQGALMYASIGKDAMELCKKLVEEFKPKREYQLQPLSTLSDRSLVKESIEKFEKLMNNPGKETINTIPVEFIFGTQLQQRIWRELMKIPPGKTKHYGEIADSMKLSPGSSRVVGNGCGSNKIAVVVPCHRVIALSGKLNGYKWGIEVKRHLLKSELGSDYSFIVTD